MTKPEISQFENMPGTSGSSENLEKRPEPIDDESPVFLNSWARIRYVYREYAAEFLGTLVLVLYGDGVVAQRVLSDGTAGSYDTIAFSWGIAVMLGFMASGGVSGGHLNPAVTFCSACFRGFSWKKVPGYIFAQLLGGFIGAYVVYGTYYQAFDAFEGVGVRTHLTAGIFCTFPQDFLNSKGQFVSEFVASALLQMGIFSLSDAFNVSSTKYWFPVGLFFLIYGIGASFGYQTGYALNMARDFAPRVAAVSVGFGNEMFSYGDGYAWVPVVAPFIGCWFGAFLYDVFIYSGNDSPVNQPYFGLGRYFKRAGKSSYGEAQGV